ncbi:DUF2505 domain-containing protein [Phenylobacterium sp.]|uniref:DUF2505 domain-containing protein n=1 Tax=Phenylobacterium sp. TaxID=1871053 RepID=UPI0027378832|nr:DUF2505 domain-containing protein [Phenylobacterium sp.]MDP3870859.1 DUF2505 domain-containing protein [Phenylobacterium sp.]
MSTKIDLEHKFSKGVASVWKMYSDRAFFERKYQDAGYSNIEVLDFQSSAKGFSITVRYDAGSDAPMPDFARKFIGERINITQTDAWDAASKTGKITTEIKGAPVKVTAEMKLEGDAKSAVNKMKWTLSCGIPLVGGKLEALFGEDIKVKSARDQKASTKILADY